MASFTVDTDGTSGDYASFNAAIAAIDNAALTEDTTVTCYASGSADDTTAVDFSAINTTSDYRLTINVGDSNYRLRVNISGGAAIQLTGGFGSYSNITIDGMTIIGHGHAANYTPTIEISHRDGTSIINGCEISTESHTYRDEIFNYVMDTAMNGINVVVNNFIVSGSTSAHAASRIFDFTDEGDQYFYNNTIIAGASTQSLYYAVSADNDNSTTWYNNVLSGFAGVYNDLTPGTADYNMTDESWDLGGANDEQDQTFVFVGSGDYHLDSTDTGAQGNGTDLSSDATYAFSDDIDGDTRTTPWDCGADQYVASGGASLSIPVAMKHYAMLRK